MTRSRRLPTIFAAIYAAFFSAVLIKNIVWSVGDQTDVIRPGLAAFPLGLIMSFAYPGERNGAFVAVAFCGALNAVLIYFLTKSFLGKRKS